MATFDPDKYFDTATNSGDWRTAIDIASYNHYERLGFQYGDRLTNVEITDAFQKRYSWWTEKDKIAKSGKAHPVATSVGPYTKKAIENLQKAESILTEPVKKSIYDKRLLEEISKANEGKLIELIKRAIRDNILTQDEKNDLLIDADNYKISRSRAEELIADEMKKVGAVYEVGGKSAVPLNKEEDFIKIIRFALKDKVLTQEEKKNLLNEADTLKISRSRVEEIISSEMKKVGATYQVEKPATATEAFPNYYDLLEISQSASNSEIEVAYKKQFSIWNSRATNPKFRDGVPLKKKLLQDARDTLSDLNRRIEYDRQLKEALETPISANGSGIPKLEINKTSFEYNNLRMGASFSDSFTINNGGGGILSGPIKTNKKWLKATQISIDTARHKQDISFYINTSDLVFGLKDTGTIEIQSNGGIERINVNISIEEDKEAISRFRTGLTTGGSIFGALLGLLISNSTFVEGVKYEIPAIAGIIGLIGTVIVSGMMGRLGAGFWTLIIGLSILVPLSHFPYVFSPVSWALPIASITYMFSTSIWREHQRGDKKISIAAIASVITLSVLIISVGTQMAKKEAVAQNAQTEILQQTLSKLLGDWQGNVGNKGTKLFITRNGDQLSGKMVYDGVEEKMSLLVDKGGVVILKGTDYKRLSGVGNFSLDTFYVTSITSTKLEGNFIDTNGNKGEWRVAKVVDKDANSDRENKDLDGSLPSQAESTNEDKLATSSNPETATKATPERPTGFAASVTSSPSGATVYIDKKQVGSTPLKLTLEQGSHGIGIEKGGYIAIWDRVNVRDDRRNEFAFNLERE